MKSVVIVGAGLAGVRCAETLRAEGFDGRIVLVGEESHRPYERPALSKEFLADMRDDISLRPPSRYDDLGIELVLGARVESVRAGVAYADAGTWRFDGLVLATGATPRHLPGPRPSQVRHLRTLDDALSLRERLQPGRRLVVVGSGFVGAEVATTAARIGVDVTVVEAAKSPLGGLLGDEVGSVLAAAYRRLGIELRLGASVERVEPRFVLLDDGTSLAHDVVLVAIGVEPSVDLPADDAIAVTWATAPGSHRW